MAQRGGQRAAEVDPEMPDLVWSDEDIPPPTATPAKKPAAPAPAPGTAPSAAAAAPASAPKPGAPASSSAKPAAKPAAAKPPVSETKPAAPTSAKAPAPSAKQPAKAPAKAAAKPPSARLSTNGEDADSEGDDDSLPALVHSHGDEADELEKGTQKYHIREFQQRCGRISILVDNARIVKEEDVDSVMKMLHKHNDIPEEDAATWIKTWTRWLAKVGIDPSERLPDVVTKLFTADADHLGSARCIVELMNFVLQQGLLTKEKFLARWDANKMLNAVPWNAQTRKRLEPLVPVLTQAPSTRKLKGGSLIGWAYIVGRIDFVKYLLSKPPLQERLSKDLLQQMLREHPDLFETIVTQQFSQNDFSSLAEAASSVCTMTTQYSVFAGYVLGVLAIKCGAVEGVQSEQLQDLIKKYTAAKSDPKANEVRQALLDSLIPKLKQVGHVPDGVDFSGALHSASERNHAAAASILLKAFGVDPLYRRNLRTAKEVMPIHVAVQSRSKDVLAALLDVDPQTLSEQTRSLVGNTTNSIMHVAIDARWTEGIEMLINKGVSVNEPKNRQKKTPLDTAPPELKRQIVELEKVYRDKVAKAHRNAKRKKKRAAAGQPSDGSSTAKTTDQAPDQDGQDDEDEDEELSASMPGSFASLVPVAKKGPVEYRRIQNVQTVQYDLADLDEDADDTVAGTASAAVPAAAPPKRVAPLESAPITFKLQELSGCPWEVALSSKAMTALQQKPLESAKQIIGQIVKLAQGYRGGKVAKPLKGVADFHDFHIYESYLKDGWRMIFQTVIDFSTRSNNYVETIRVWDIVPHDRVSDVLHYLNEKARHSIPDSRKYRLAARANVSEQGKLVLPNSYEIINAPSKPEAPQKSLPKEPATAQTVSATENNAYLLEKFYTLKSDVVLRILNDPRSKDEDVSLSYELRIDQEEFDIIQNPNNILLLGRSGTGKTTCAVLKLWAAQRQQIEAGAPLMINPAAPRKRERVHQLFVTVSPTLCNHVRRYLQGLENTYGDAREAALQMKAIPTTFGAVPDARWPLVMTFGHFIRMLDNSLERPFFTAAKTADPNAPADAATRKALRHHLGWQGGELDFDPNKAVQYEDPFPPSAKQIITFEEFATRVYPEITKSMKAKERENYPPVVLYTEFLSYIKGYRDSLDTPDGELSQEAYINLGTKVSPMYSAGSGGSREEVYKLYLKYKAEMRRLGLYDKIDPIFHIMKELAREKRGIPTIHRCFVDEVQDLTQAEIRLFFEICTQPERGFFLAGDTAQAIERGVGFRFADVKSIFYTRNITPPKEHQLVRNFRSSATILNVSSTVVDLIVKFFPMTIDPIKHDEGSVRGHLPVIIDGQVQDFILYLVGNEQGTPIEFGAHQVIIVRDEKARQNLPPELKNSLVMTPLEAKGLEFDDVFLYNYFHDAPDSANFAACTAYLQEILDKGEPADVSWKTSAVASATLDALARAGIAPGKQKFNPEHDRILCSELKTLYMCLTRAKTNLWIYDSGSRGAALMSWWLQSKLVVSSTTEDLKQRGAVLKKAKPTEWVKQGFEILKRGLYKLAMVCFDKAGEVELVKKAEACLLASEAWTSGKDEAGAKSLYRRAAQIFKASAPVPEHLLAARAYYSAGDFEQAAIQYKLANNNREAAQCFEEAGNPMAAGELYKDISVEDMARCYHLAHQYDLGLKVLGEMNVPRETIRSFLRKAIAYHARRGREGQAKAVQYVKFGTFFEREQQLQILKAENCVDEVAAMLTEQGNLLEAAQFCASKNRPDLAADLYAQVGSADSSERALELQMVRYRDAQKLYLSEKNAVLQETHLQTAVKSLVSALSLAPTDGNYKSFELQIELARLAKDVTSIMNLLHAASNAGIQLIRCIESVLPLLKAGTHDINAEIEVRLRQLQLFGDMLHATDVYVRAVVSGADPEPSAMLALVEEYLQIKTDIDAKFRVLQVGSALQVKLGGKPLVHDSTKVRVLAADCFREARYLLAQVHSMHCNTAVMRVLERIDALSPCVTQWTAVQHDVANCKKPTHPSINHRTSVRRAELLVRAARIADAVHLAHSKWPAALALNNNLPSPNLYLCTRLWNSILTELMPIDVPWLIDSSAVREVFRGDTVRRANVLLPYASYLWNTRGPRAREGFDHDVPFQVWRIYRNLCMRPDLFTDLLLLAEASLPSNESYVPGFDGRKSIYGVLPEVARHIAASRMDDALYTYLPFLLYLEGQGLVPSAFEYLNLIEEVIAYLLFAGAQSKPAILSTALMRRWIDPLSDHQRSAVLCLHGVYSRLDRVKPRLIRFIQNHSNRRDPLPVLRALALLRMIEVSTNGGVTPYNVREVVAPILDEALLKRQPLSLLLNDDSTHKYTEALAFFATKGDPWLRVSLESDAAVSAGDRLWRHPKGVILVAPAGTPSAAAPVDDDNEAAPDLPNSTASRSADQSMSSLLEQVLKQKESGGFVETELQKIAALVREAWDQERRHSVVTRPAVSEEQIATAKPPDTAAANTAAPDSEQKKKKKKKGLPRRPGVTDCFFFIANGYCGYGRACKYNHPDLPALTTTTILHHDLEPPSEEEERLDEVNAQLSDANRLLATLRATGGQNLPLWVFQSIENLGLELSNLDVKVLETSVLSKKEALEKERTKLEHACQTAVLASGAVAPSVVAVPKAPAPAAAAGPVAPGLLSVADLDETERQEAIKIIKSLGDEGQRARLKAAITFQVAWRRILLARRVAARCAARLTGKKKLDSLALIVSLLPEIKEPSGKDTRCLVCQTDIKNATSHSAEAGHKEVVALLKQCRSVLQELASDRPKLLQSFQDLERLLELRAQQRANSRIGSVEDDEDEQSAREMSQLLEDLSPNAVAQMISVTPRNSAGMKVLLSNLKGLLDRLNNILAREQILIRRQ